MSPILPKNARVFIYFRIFFNCRFYYPIFAILFLDFGLSLEEFALLNSIWALSILLAEVPSGALADLWSRKKLLITASLFMVLEMIFLIAAPRDGSTTTFIFCLLNRIFSGLAEAAASGADEALAYDSLKGVQKEKDQQWNKIISNSMRKQSIFMILVMLLGSFFYDWERLNHWFPSWSAYLNRDWTLKIPLLLNTFTAFACLFTAFRFIDPSSKKTSSFNFLACKKEIQKTGSQIWKSFLWILNNHFVFSFILASVIFDSTIRVFITLNSSYFRYIEIPDLYFGIIGAALALVGYFASWLGAKSVEILSLKKNLILLFITLLASLLGLQLTKSFASLAFIVSLFICMFLIGYYLSFYLNRESPTEFRATLLSFKGLGLNLFYGAAGLLYAYYARMQENVFEKTLPFFSTYLLGFAVIFIILKKLHKNFVRSKT